MWQESVFSCRRDVFTFYIVKKFCKCCTLNVFSEDNAAVNCITFQHKKGSSVNFDGSFYASQYYNGLSAWQLKVEKRGHSSLSLCLGETTIE